MNQQKRVKIKNMTLRDQQLILAMLSKHFSKSVFFYKKKIIYTNYINVDKDC